MTTYFPEGINAAGMGALFAAPAVANMAAPKLTEYASPSGFAFHCDNYEFNHTVDQAKGDIDSFLVVADHAHELFHERGRFGAGGADDFKGGLLLKAIREEFQLGGVEFGEEAGFHLRTKNRAVDDLSKSEPLYRLPDFSAFYVSLLQLADCRFYSCCQLC